LAYGARTADVGAAPVVSDWDGLTGLAFGVAAAVLATVALAFACALQRDETFFKFQEEDHI